MAIWSKIFSDKKEVEQPIVDSSDVSDKLFSYVHGLIDQKDLSGPCDEIIKRSVSLSGEEKENELTRGYFCLEKIITENKPPIIKKEISKIKLRKDILQNLPIDQLFLKMKLPFLNERERLISIFVLASRGLIKYLKSNIGEENFKTFLARATIGGGLEGRVFLREDSLVFNVDTTNYIHNEEFEYNLKNLFSKLTQEVSSGFGREVSESILASSFESFISIYPPEFVQVFLDLSPLDFLLKQRTALLAKEELQKKFIETANQEKKKRDEAEILSRKLEQALADLNANKAAVLNLLEDVGEEKNRVEKEVEKGTEELKSERAVLRSTIDSLPVAYFLISTDFILLENNSLLLKMFSVDSISSFSDMEKRLNGFFSLKDHCLSVLNNMKPEVFKDISFGNKFFKIYLQPVASTETGAKIGLLGLIEDTTEQKVLDRSKDEFFSIASHELRTPLTAIMGNTSMILEFFGEQLQNKEVKQMVEDVHEASTRLLKIVGDFLDVSRLEQGKILLNLEKVDIGKIAKEEFRDFESSASLKGLSFILEEPPKDLFVFGDVGRIKQIVSNLISNAINYTQKGEIKIYIKKDDPGTVSLYVKDSGVGISKENRNLLFRKFQQAQDKLLTRDASRSTGLGLYISRLLANAMNGTVELVESDVGKGSIFRLVLPAKI